MKLSRIRVSTSDELPAGLLGSFGCFMASHEQEICAQSGLSPGAEIRIELLAHGDELRIERRDDLRIHLPASSAQEVLACAQSFQWANGMVLLPTALALVQRDVLGPATATLADIAAHQPVQFKRNLGLLWGALRLLALDGWLRLDGSDLDTSFALTPLGSVIVRTMKEHPAPFIAAVRAIRWSQRYHELLRSAQHSGEDCFAAYRSLVDLCRDGWQLPEQRAGLERRAVKKLRTYLDGLVLGPTLVGLGMPVFCQQGAARVESARSVLSLLQDNPSSVHALAAQTSCHAPLLEQAMELLWSHGLVEHEGPHCLRLSARGRAVAKVAPPVLALPGSYLRSYELIDEILFGNPDPLGIEQDLHVDRIMNLYGSSGAGSGPASQEIKEHILRRLFDETPLSEQPAGIADIGCGDGRTLASLAEYVIDHCRRGRHLREYPLYLVGADYNGSARERARATLERYSEVEGVHLAILYAEVGSPSEYDAGLRALALPMPGRTAPLGLSDLVHTFMFLTHNRKLRMHSREEALAVLRCGLQRADPAELAATLSSAHGAPFALATSEGDLLTQIEAQFRTAFSDADGLVPGVVAAADFIQFLDRWAPYSRHGLIILEGHSPWAFKMLEEPPAQDDAWMKGEKLPHPFNWGMHFLSRQYLLPYEEFSLALVLAGFRPVRGEIYGRINPRGLPSLDLLCDYRFLSIGCYQSVSA